MCEAHDHRRFLCKKCNVYFTRKHDLKRNGRRVLPRLVIEQSPSNITCNREGNASSNRPNTSTNAGISGYLSTSDSECEQVTGPINTANTSSSNIPTQPTDPIFHTTRMLECKSPIDLAKDLALSESDDDLADNKTTIAINTDKSGVIDTHEQSTNTTPDVKVTLQSQQEVYIRTFGQKDLGTYKIPKVTYNSQVGYLKSMRIHNKEVQTE